MRGSTGGKFYRLLPEKENIEGCRQISSLVFLRIRGYRESRVFFLPKSTETMNFLRPEPDNFDLHLSALTL